MELEDVEELDVVEEFDDVDELVDEYPSDAPPPIEALLDELPEDGIGYNCPSIITELEPFIPLEELPEELPDPLEELPELLEVLPDPELLEEPDDVYSFPPIEYVFPLLDGVDDCVYVDPLIL